jgi:tungstate transport system ATP-binding protein
MLDGLAIASGIEGQGATALPRALGEARDLVYRIPGATLIDHVNLSLPRGTLTVVMGANGAGKSLLLRLMHGLLSPSSGQVLWDGRPLDMASRRRQAMVFQRPVLLRRSVAANLRFVLGLRGGDPARVQELLVMAGLADRARQPARLLSGGEQQRLCLARALALNPQVLFLDEPTANLDPASTAAIEATVRQVSATGTKVVFVTHDLAQARRLADDVVFLERGRVAEHRPAPSFFERPDSAPARDYLDGRLTTRPSPRERPRPSLTIRNGRQQHER